MFDKPVTLTADEFQVDLAIVAAAFGLEPVGLQERMRAGDVVSLCERGEGIDAGRFRLTFRHVGRVLRMTLAGEGRVLKRRTFDKPTRSGTTS